jgi:small-conductance mechanosensitive channel
LRNWAALIAEFADDLVWRDVAAALALAVGVFVLLWGLRLLARRHHERVAATSQREVFELPALVASRTTTAFMVVVAAFAGLEFFILPVALDGFVRKVALVALFWQAGLWASTAVMTWLDHRSHEGLKAGKVMAGSIGILRFAARVVIWAMVVLLTLENLGTDITALVAGLGIGGIAVALALQNVLGDLLASLSIALDQPFVVGDFLAVGDNLGAVEYIGIKSTRLRSLTGEQIVMPNSDLLSQPVRNFGRMVQRRVTFTLGLEYETPRDLLERVPWTIREIVQAQPDVRFDRCHFAKYGDSSLQFDVVYFVLSADFNRHMDLQQSILFRIHEAFEEMGIRFAYPTQRVWFANPPFRDPGAEV